MGSWRFGLRGRRIGGGRLMDDFGVSRHSRPMHSTGRPRILFVINSLCGGGAERIMSILLANSKHKEAEFDVALALLDREPAAYETPEWVTTYQLDSRFGLVRSCIELRRLVRSIRPDITVSFLTRANVANCLVMRTTGRPAIISERINTDMQLGTGPRSLVTKAIVRFAYPAASRVIAVAGGVGDTLVRRYGVDPARIEVIPNPVDVEAIRERASQGCAEAPDEPFVFAMGRLVPNKNFALLVRAFARAQIPGSLVIAGEGPERAALLKLANELGFADRLWLTGFLPNPHALLARADAFVLSSNAEGFPNSLVEALALGVPSIATNCADGPAEILAGSQREAVAGTLVTEAGIMVPVNDVEALSAALQKICDPELRRRLSEGGRRIASTYSVAVSVDRYWQVIERELADRPLAEPV